MGWTNVTFWCTCTHPERRTTDATFGDMCNDNSVARMSTINALGAFRTPQQASAPIGGHRSGRNWHTHDGAKKCWIYDATLLF